MAKILLNKLDILPDANVQDMYWTIGQHVSRRTGLIKSQISLKNHLHAQLSHHYPSYMKFFSDIDGKCALVFWHTFPSPQLLEGLTAEELAKVLRKASHNTCSTKKAEEILAFVKRDGDTTRNYQHYRDFLILEVTKNVHVPLK